MYETYFGEWLRNGLGDYVVVGGDGNDPSAVSPGTFGYYEKVQEPGDEVEYVYYGSADEVDMLIALDTPMLQASNTGSGVRLSWNKVQGAAEYEISRAPKGSTDYQPLKTVTAASYTDKSALAGTAYAYRVCAKNGMVYSKNAAVSIMRNPFTDVKAGDSYFNAVLWAYSNGIISGTSPKAFSPNTVCKRYQLVVFLYKFNNKYHFK